jgi:regulator of protease activity HflC (stomatin/prohibitin superfamily)
VNKKTIPAVALAAMALAGCSSVSTESDLTAVQYAGGATQSKTFKACVPPSTKEWGGISDTFYEYPASQRNFVFDSNAQTKDSGSFTFVTKDGIEMTVTGVANFRLNTECEALRAFHENIGNRYQAYFSNGNETPAGWNRVLTDYIGRPLDTAIDRAGQKYDSEALYNDAATKAAWEKDVVASLPELVNRQTDGDTEFFQNWAITLQKPELPQSIKDARTEKEAAVARAEAKEAEATAQVKTAEAQKALEEAEAAKQKVWIDALGVEGWLQKQALDAGINPFQPGGTPLVNVP